MCNFLKLDCELSGPLLIRFTDRRPNEASSDRLYCYILIMWMLM